MKRFLIVLMALCLTGCVTLQIKDDAEINAIAEIAVRRIAYQLALKEPEKVDYLISKADEILNAADNIDAVKPLLITGLRYAAEKYAGDPLIADDLVSLLKLFRVDFDSVDIDMDRGEVRTLLVLVQALKQGLKG